MAQCLIFILKKGAGTLSNSELLTIFLRTGANGSSAIDIVDILLPQLRDLRAEVFKIAYFDGKNRIIDIADMVIGAASQVRCLYNYYSFSDEGGRSI